MAKYANAWDSTKSPLTPISSINWNLKFWGIFSEILLIRSLFFLPPYAPQYNPDEYLNNDLKRNVNRKHIPLTKPELQSNLRSYLKTLQNKPHHIKKFFEAEDVKYAA